MKVKFGCISEIMFYKSGPVNVRGAHDNNTSRIRGVCSVRDE